MKNTQIILTDIVSDTITNQAGLSFLIKIEPYLKEDKKVNVSLKSITSMSSSFLNSSVGELVEKYGFDKVAELLTFSNASKFNANSLIKYFSALKTYV